MFDITESMFNRILRYIILSSVNIHKTELDFFQSILDREENQKKPKKVVNTSADSFTIDLILLILFPLFTGVNIYGGKSIRIGKPRLSYHITSPFGSSVKENVYADWIKLISIKCILHINAWWKILQKNAIVDWLEGRKECFMQLHERNERTTLNIIKIE